VVKEVERARQGERERERERAREAEGQAVARAEVDRREIRGLKRAKEAEPAREEMPAATHAREAERDALVRRVSSLPRRRGRRRGTC